MYSRLRSRLCSWCPAALSYAAVLMTRKPASNRFVFPDRSSSGFLRNLRDRDDPPRWVFRLWEVARSRCSILSIIESVGGAPTPGPGNKAPCYPANTVIVVFITGPADDPLVVSSVRVCSPGCIPDEDRWFRERILIQLLNDGKTQSEILIVRYSCAEFEQKNDTVLPCLKSIIIQIYISIFKRIRCKNTYVIYTRKSIVISTMKISLKKRYIILFRERKRDFSNRNLSNDIYRALWTQIDI